MLLKEQKLNFQLCNCIQYIKQPAFKMLAPKVIMIVDDDPDDVAFFCEALSEIDTSIKYIGVKGAEEALWLLKKNSDNHPDFIFLDLNMPKMNGKQCLKQIKSDTNVSSIPVIVYKIG